MVTKRRAVVSNPMQATKHENSRHPTWGEKMPCPPYLEDGQHYMLCCVAVHELLAAALVVNMVEREPVDEGGGQSWNYDHGMGDAFIHVGCCAINHVSGDTTKRSSAHILIICLILV